MEAFDLDGAQPAFLDVTSGLDLLKHSSDYATYLANVDLYLRNNYS